MRETIGYCGIQVRIGIGVYHQIARDHIFTQMRFWALDDHIYWNPFACKRQFLSFR